MYYKELLEQIDKYPEAKEWNSQAILASVKSGDISEEEKMELLMKIRGSDLGYLSQEEKLQWLRKWGWKKETEEYYDDEDKITELQEIGLKNFFLIKKIIDEEEKANIKLIIRELVTIANTNNISKDWSAIFYCSLELIESMKKVKDETTNAEWRMINNIGIELHCVWEEGLLTKEYLLFLKEIAESTGIHMYQFFSKSLTELKHNNLLTKDNLSFFITIVKIAKSDSKEIFETIIKIQKENIPLSEQNKRFILEIVRKWININGISTRNNLNKWFNLKYGFVTLYKAGILSEGKETEIAEYLATISHLCGEVNENTFQAFAKLEYHFKQFKIDFFPKLIIPITKIQTIGSFIYYEIIAEIKNLTSEEDLEILLKIQKKLKYRTYDFYKHILVEGLNKNLIANPLSKDKDLILSFLKETNVALIEAFEEYKLLYYSDNPEKHLHIKSMMKKINNLKKEIISGKLSEEYDNKLLIGIIYSIFPPELTVVRENYELTYQEREDRQKDIPSSLKKIQEINVSISKGSFALKKGESFSQEAWNTIIEVVNEANNEKSQKVNPVTIGLLLLQAKINKQLKNNREIIKQLYIYYTQANNETLPTFNSNHETIMKYKEYVGDRLKNDLILTCMQKASEEQTQTFNQLVQQIEINKDYRKLAKIIQGLLQSKLQEDKKLERINHILLSNNLPRTEKLPPIQIEQWLMQQTNNTINKTIIQNIFNELIGENYQEMQKEVTKFEFKQTLKDKRGEKYTFKLSKRKAYSCAMYNFGVCVASDNKLWNSPDFWQMIIFDKNQNANGGVIYRTIEEEGKKYLVVSIQPNSTILGQTSPKNTYKKIIQYSKTMVELLKYDALLLPKNASIHSNRGSIQEEIQNYNYPEITLKNTYEFSYDPYKYSYQEFYLVR